MDISETSDLRINHVHVPMLIHHHDHQSEYTGFLFVVVFLSLNIWGAGCTQPFFPLAKHFKVLVSVCICVVPFQTLIEFRQEYKDIHGHNARLKTCHGHNARLSPTMYTHFVVWPVLLWFEMINVMQTKVSCLVKSLLCSSSSLFL